MKHFNKWFIAAFLGLIVMTSCVDEIKFGNAFIDKAPGSDVTIDTVFNNAEYARRFLWDTYSNLYYGLPYYWGGNESLMNTGIMDALSDCFHSHNDWDEVNRQYYSGAYIPGNDGKFGYTIKNVWVAVRASYIFMENIDKTPGMDDSEKARLKAEAKCIIASRYFDIFRHYGGLPLIKKSFSGTEAAYDYPRGSVEETVNFMTGLLDEAAKDLPWKLDDSEQSNWDGRFTKAAAMGLKCKILVFAASPLFNDAQPYCTTGDQTAVQKKQVWYGEYRQDLWKQCLTACQDFFTELTKDGYYGLVQAAGSRPGDYRAAFRKAYSTRGTTEMLLSTRVRYTTNNSDWNYCFHTWNGYGGYTPTEEYAEMFPWKDGHPFNYDKLEQTSGLDSMFMDSKYNLTRDPRLYETIVVNNLPMSLNDNGDMSGRFAELWVKGREAQDCPTQETGQYATGYANNKFYMYDDSKNKPTEWPYLRLSELYLIYAEALAQNGDYDGAAQQVDVVRSRVGLGGLAACNPTENLHDKDVLINEILRERACELGLEETRFFDMIRYKRADLFKEQLHGLRIYRLDNSGNVLNASWSDKKSGQVGYSTSGPIHFKYEKFPLVNKSRTWWTSFDPKWYLSAFPPTEINKGYGLTQNPGW